MGRGLRFRSEICAGTALAAAAIALCAGPADAACIGAPASVTCTGTVSRVGDGVSAVSTTGPVSVTVSSGSVTGTANGVAAQTSTFEQLNVVANGNVTGMTGAGIGVTGDIGYSQVDIGAASTVTGVTGVQVRSNGAYGIINNDGAIIGKGGSALTFDLGVGSDSINNNGSITGTGATAITSGTAMTVTSGTVVLNNNATGVVDGTITGLDTTEVNNFGAWKNAAGSSIGTFTNTGVLTLSTTGTGTLAIANGATFGAASTTTLNITASGASDKITVAGDAQLGGLLSLHALGTGYVKGTHYTIMTVGGIVTGTFANVQTDLPKYLPILTWMGNDLTVGLAQYDYRDLALTRNQYAAASSVAQASATPLTAAGTALIVALDAASANDVQAGLTKIAGDGLTAAKSMALRQGSQFLETVNDQQAFWRSREAVDPNGITVMPTVAPVNPGPRWYAGQPQALPPRLPPPPGDRTLRMWISGFGSQQRTSGSAIDGSANQTGHTAGGAMGVDIQLGRNLLLGAAGGYSVGAFNVGDRKTSGQNLGIHAALYLGFTANGFYGATNIGYANYTTSTARTVDVTGLPTEQIKGSYGSNEVRVRMEAGKLFDLGIGSITAFTAIQGATLTSSTYVESSQTAVGPGVLALAFPRQTTYSVPFEIGFRAETRLRMGAAMFAPWVQVAYVHEFSPNRDDTQMLAMFPGTPQTVYGARDARSSLRVKGGAQVSLSPRAALFVTAEATIASNQRVYAGRGGFRYGW